ncbi:MAG: glycosyltransferase family 2 protein [Pseudomonadota bacterium]
MLEIEVQGNITHGVASVDLDGWFKQVRVVVPLRVGKTAKRIVWVPLGVRSIRVQAINTLGSWQLQRVTWTWLTPWFAHDRLARRLSNVHDDFSGLSVFKVKRMLHRESVSLGCGWKRLALKAYEATFDRFCSHYDYTAWCRWKEPAHLKVAPLSIEERLRGTVFSLLMPIVEEPPNGMASIAASIESLWQQVYGRWELCIVMTPRIEKRYGDSLRSFLGECRRVTLSTMSGTSQDAFQQRALIMATGDWVGWLSSGDTLASLAFVQLQRAVAVTPSLQLVYTDEDIISANGERLSPHLKPEWTPDLLLSHHYLGRLTLYRRTMLWRLEAYRAITASELSTSAEAFDYIRALRFLIWWQQSRSPVSVARVPGIFYHRHEDNAEARKQSDITALVRQYLKFQEAGKVGIAPGVMPASVTLSWPLPAQPPLVSLIIPTRDCIELLQPCVNAILSATEYRRFELIIIDNDSKCPKALAFLDEISHIDARVKVVRWPYAFNYAAMNNMAVTIAKGSIVGLVNNDIEPLNGQWLTEMVTHAHRPDIGCVGAKLYYPEGMIQHAGVVLGVGGIAGHAHRFYPQHSDGYSGRLKHVQNVSAVTGACLLVRKQLYLEVGGLNEEYLAVAYNDVDFCLKVQSAGYRNVWTPHAELIHHESATRHAQGNRSKPSEEYLEAAYMQRTWGSLLQDDPAYHPYLTRRYEDFSLS